MCRLFGLHAGEAPVGATFWLLDAPDSLAEQSRRNPDGTGIGTFTAAGEPVVEKQPMAAWQDTEFAAAARDLTGRTFVGHVRYASTGGRASANTHPFVMDERLMAHNGVVLGLDRLEERLDRIGVSGLVHGQSDSERVFALITGETRRHGGDLQTGLVAAIDWIGSELPLYAVNLVIATDTELWAVRYPGTHPLFVLERGAGGRSGQRHLDVRSSRIRAHATEFAARPAVVLATEPMDADPGWQPMAAGELLRIGPDLACHRSTPFVEPMRLLSLAELDPAAAASQHPGS